MWHETELLPYRLDGFPVATDRAVGSGAEIGRTACEVRASRDHQRDPVRHAQRLYVAQFATRFSPVSDRVLLLPPVATGWHLGADSCQAPRASAPPRGQATEAVGRGARQPECQNDRTRRATWLRRGEKKSPAANGTWSSTRSDCCGHWSLRPLAYKTAMAADWPSKPSAARSSSPRSSGRTKHIARWSSGPKKWRWFIEILTRPAHTFQIQPKRWIVERTFGWLNRSRRLAKSYERTIESDQAFVLIAMIHLMVKRIA